MARYGRDYGPARGGYDAGFGRRTGGGYYGQGPGSSRYDRGYEGGGWGMGGLFNTIVGRGAERGGGYDRGLRAGAGYDRDFRRRDFGRSGPGGPERGEGWRGFGGQGRGYDRSPGGARVNRSRYDRGWS
jgi:hypothetical protein